MSSLHEALQCLKPTAWDDVPQEPAELRKYVREIFKHSRLVAESLPDPPSPESDSYTGLDLDKDDLAFPDIAPSHTRVGETDPEITALQKEWGKPLKMGGPRDNPLDVTVWKLSANDGGGSWFGRRSVHEGLPFDRWRNKMSSEYDETLKTNQKKISKGQTPDGSIRGIGAEEKVESIEIKDDNGSVLGELIVYHVSAQFPKPTAPRDFVALIINSDSGLQIGGTKQPGRSWMMISKPCDHPDVPAKNGYTRGNYESVELIREIPRESSGSSGSSSSSQKTKKNSDSSSSGTQRSGVSSNKEGKPSDPEGDVINPVEWIMVTRSDPGGSIPRWMVDKGTPRSVGLDAAKFINWAVQKDKPSKKDKDPETEATNASTSEARSGHSVNDKSDGDQAEDSDSDYESLESDGEHSHHGLIASVTGLLSSGLERYGPQVLGYGSNTHEAQSHGRPSEAPEDAQSTNHLSPGSARRKPSSEVESSKSREPDLASLASVQSDMAAPAVDDLAHNNMSPEELIKMTKNGKLTSHEKELAKLALRKREVEAKLEEVRAELEKLNISQLPTNPGTPLKGINETDSDASGLRKRAATNRSSTPSSNATPQSPQNSSEKSSQTATPDAVSNSKVATQLLSGETKLLKQLRKIEASQLKVASKIETKQRKNVERSEKSKSKSEVESLRQEVHDLKKEVRQLRGDRQKWVDLVSSLQAENSRLVDQGEK